MFFVRTDGNRHRLLPSTLTFFERSICSILVGKRFETMYESVGEQGLFIDLRVSVILTFTNDEEILNRRLISDSDYDGQPNQCFDSIVVE